MNTSQCTHPTGPGQHEMDPSTPRVLLAWDAPNMDMALSELLGGKPEPKQRPVWWCLGTWLKERAEASGACAEGVVFVNVPDGAAERMRPWVEAVRRAGFAVFVKPKRGDSDIDDDIARWVSSQRSAYPVSEVLIASGDRRAFQHLLEDVQRADTSVAFLGFTEFAGAPTTVPFIDLETIPGLFHRPLPRTRLDDLPAQGTLLAPLGQLGHRPPGPPTPDKATASTVNAEFVDQVRGTLTDILERLPEATGDRVLFSGVWAELVARYPKVAARLGHEKATHAFAALAEDLPWHLKHGGDGVFYVVPTPGAAETAA